MECQVTVQCQFTTISLISLFFSNLGRKHFIQNFISVTFYSTMFNNIQQLTSKPIENAFHHSF